MSCCTNWDRALILASGVTAEAVRVVADCLISAEASRRPAVKLRYQFPISCQLPKPLEDGPPGGKKDTTICPAIPAIGGISSSLRIAFTSLIAHCHWLLPWVGFTSG